MSTALSYEAIASACPCNDKNPSASCLSVFAIAFSPERSRVIPILQVREGASSRKCLLKLQALWTLLAHLFHTSCFLTKSVAYDSREFTLWCCVISTCKLVGLRFQIAFWSYTNSFWCFCAWIEDWSVFKANWDIYLSNLVSVTKILFLIQRKECFWKTDTEAESRLFQFNEILLWQAICREIINHYFFHSIFWKAKIMSSF